MSAYRTAPPSQRKSRDRDLLTVDSVLTDEGLDNLWNWFSEATENRLDPQMIFVKFVNSIRKPYIEELENQQRTPFTSGNSATATSKGCDRPSELEAGTVVAEDGYESSLWNTLGQNENAASIYPEPKAHGGISSMPGPLINPPATIKPIRVAIKPANLSTTFVQLNSKGVTSFLSEGGGSVHTAGLALTKYGILEMEYLATSIVAFKSTTDPNVYLRADPQDLTPGERWSWGGGVVNCQFTCGKLERFCIQKAGENGEVAIELAEHPGIFLRANTWTESINLQGVRGEWERFFIMVVG